MLIRSDKPMQKFGEWILWVKHILNVKKKIYQKKLF
jgi:hypothetical protein